MYKKSILIASLFCFSLIFISCSEQSEYPTKDFVHVVSKDKVLYKTIATDLDNDGIDEHIVLTNFLRQEDEKEIDGSYNFYQFDVLEIFTWSPKKNDYVSMFIDTLYFGTECNIESFPNNQKIVVVNTYSGGEDTVVAKGMKLYLVKDKKVTIPFFDEVGSPSFVYRDNNSAPIIVVKGLIVFDITDRKPIEYIHSIYTYNNDNYQESNLQFKDQFLLENKELLTEYYKVVLDSKGTNTKETTDLFIKIVTNFIIVDEYEEAEKFFTLQRKNIYNYNPDGYIEVVRYLYDNGFDYKSELDTLANKVFSDAVKHKEQKNYLEAEKLFKKVLFIDYNFMDAYFELGELELLQGKYHDALSFYQQVATFITENKRLYLGLVKSYIGMKDYVSAVPYAERYMLLDSISNDALFVKDFLSKNQTVASK
jgi:tetratricopeptide (TPR) repeat protein/uncharacterized protein YcfL